MSDSNEKNLSAQVIVKPKGEGKLPPTENITAENVHQMMPAAEDFKKAKSYFKNLGFEVDAGFANSFSISGDRKLFEKVFDEKTSLHEKLAKGGELKLGKLSAEIKKIVETVTFTEPPDFGPGNF